MRKVLCLSIIFLTFILCSCLSTSGEGINNTGNAEKFNASGNRKNPKVYVEMIFDFDNIKESEAAWLGPSLSKKLSRNFSKYTDYYFYDKNSRVESPTYQLVTTIKKTKKGYSLSSKIKDLENKESKATITSSTKKNVSELFLSAGNAVNEITIKICEQLGFPVPELEQIYLLEGETGIPLEEQQKVYDKYIKEYKYIIADIDNEIESLSSSTDSTDSEAISLLEKLNVEKSRAEDKLKLALEDKKIALAEIERRKAGELRDSKRSNKEKEKFNSISEDLNEKLQNALDGKVENQTLLDKIQVIELKKNAVVDIHNKILTERQNIYDTTLKNILNERKHINESPYNEDELMEDGKTPYDSVLKERNDLYIKAKNNFISEGQNNISKATGNLISQKNKLLSEINSDYSNLGSGKISTLGNNLAVIQGPYNKDKNGWDLIVTVRNDNMVLFQTESFLSLGVFIGQDPREYFLNDYFGFHNDVDFYGNFVLLEEPSLVFELEYSAKLSDEGEPSLYDFNFYNFKCYDVQSLTVNEDGLSSSKTSNLTLKEDSITKQIFPVCDLKPTLEEIPDFKQCIESELEVIKNREIIDVSSVKKLPAGTSGSFGRKGSYVEFGTWPQSIKSDDVYIDDTVLEVKNGWNCYNGSDGFYYVKVKAEPQEEESLFSNGNVIEKGAEYYFKIEPIKWRVVTDDYQGGKLLVAENILAAREFDSDDNNYKYSDIRKWLNNDFIKMAFTKEAIESINTVIVDNSAKSTGYDINDYACENTEDKIFLLSGEEITENSFGFDIDDYEGDAARKRKATDYSIATGAFASNYKSNCYWLRSPYCSSRTVRFIDNEGTVIRNDNISSHREGVVPALTINFY